MANAQLKRLAEEEFEMEMTPMIDVTFLLLIFFMCTLKFKTLEGKLSAYLPKDVGVNTTQADPIEKVEILVQVKNPGTKLDPRTKQPWDGNPNHRFIFGSDRVLEYGVGPRRTNKISDLADRLEELHRADKERPATIDARPGTVYEDVVKVLDAAIDAGFTEITFVGSYED